MITPKKKKSVIVLALVAVVAIVLVVIFTRPPSLLLTHEVNASIKYSQTWEDYSDSVSLFKTAVDNQNTLTGMTTELNDVTKRFMAGDSINNYFNKLLELGECELLFVNRCDAYNQNAKILQKQASDMSSKCKTFTNYFSQVKSYLDAGDIETGDLNTYATAMIPLMYKVIDAQSLFVETFSLIFINSIKPDVYVNETLLNFLSASSVWLKIGASKIKEASIANNYQQYYSQFKAEAIMQNNISFDEDILSSEYFGLLNLENFYTSVLAGNYSSYYNGLAEQEKIAAGFVHNMSFGGGA